MLHLRMNMPFVLMAFYGSLMIIIVMLARMLLKNKLPKFVFPALWCVILVRLLIPFSLSSPLTIKASDDSLLSVPTRLANLLLEETETATGYAFATDTITQATYDSPSLSSGSQDKISEVTEDTVTTSLPAEDTGIAQVSVTYEGAYDYGSLSLRYLDWRISFIFIYFLGLLITVGILSFQKYRYFVKLKNRLLIEHNETINNLLREMDMGHILVFSNDEIASPLVCGLFRPRIYLPTRMDFENTELLRHILSHETMHIKRKDNFIKTAMLIALCLNWFNPLIWLMTKCLASDLEAACDEAVLRQYNDEDERKNYAFSLLAMAITGNRSTLLYSAFSKTEVEKRIKNILNYKKASALLLAVTAAFMLCSTTLFATGVQAPFYSRLSSYCSSSNSRWAACVELTRDISLGKNSKERADSIVLDILSKDTTNDTELMDIQMKEALSNEFQVEKSAFHIDFDLRLSAEEKKAEYDLWKLIQTEEGWFIYYGEPVRTFIDEMGGYYQSREVGLIDITVQRDRFGTITNIIAQHPGDSEFDRRTQDIERNRTNGSITTSYQTSVEFEEATHN